MIENLDNVRYQDILEEFTVPAFNKNFSNWKPSPKKQYPKGIYVAVPVNPQEFNSLRTTISSTLGLNPIKATSSHITIIYSRTPVDNFRPINQSEKFVVYPTKDPFKIFGKGTKDSPLALVLTVESPGLNKLNKDYARRYNLRQTFNDFQAHITILYNLESQLGIEISKRGRQKMEKLLNSTSIKLPRRITTGFQYFQALK